MWSDPIIYNWFLSPTTALSLLCCMTTIALYVWYSYIHSPYQHFKKVGIHGPVPKVFHGNGLEANRIGPLKYQKHLAETYGSVVGFYVGISPTLQVSDLDMLKEIMIKHFNTAFTNRRHVPPLPLNNPITDEQQHTESFPALFKKDYKYNQPALGILDAKDDDWRRTRHVLTPTFSAHKMKLMETIIAKSVKNIVEKVDEMSKKGESVEVHRMFGQYTMEVILASAFGRDKNVQNTQNDRLIQAAIGSFEALGQTKPDSAVSKLVYMFPWLSVPMNRMVRNSTLASDWDYLVKSAESLVKKRREENGNEKFKDLLQLMLDAHKDDAGGDEKGLTDKEIVAQCEVILLAGYETTSNALSYVSYLLALNPEVQDKLREEIEEYYAENPDSSFYEAAQKIEYLDRVLNESLRLYPPVDRTFRESSKDVVINGITIPKGTYVMIPIHYIHHNPEYWPEPEKFDPERFTAEAKANRHPMSFMPFGMGPRNCIGMRFALLEAKMALIEILRKCRFVQTSETEVPLQLKVGITTSPKNGIILKVEPIN